MRGLGAHLQLKFPQLVVPIREKGDLLVHLQALRLQHLIQTSLRLGIKRLHKPKALVRGRLLIFILCKASHTLADNDLEIMLLVKPVAYVSPSNANFKASIRRWQKVPVAGITFNKALLFLTQLGF